VKTAFYSFCIVLFLNCKDVHQIKKASDLEYIQLKTSLVDLNQNKVNLTSFEGKKIVINYWATWCGPCIKEMPELKRAEEILQNYNYFLDSIKKEKPDSMKGEFIKNICITSTMGISYKVGAK